MSGFEETNNNEGFEEVSMSHSTDEEEHMATATTQSDPVGKVDITEAVNVSKYDGKGEEQEKGKIEEGEPDSAVSMKKGWGIVSGWMKKGAEEVKRVTNETIEATAPARGQFYDMSVKIAHDITPATKVVTDVAGSTVTVMTEALVSTSEIISTGFNNVSQELSEFATEIQHGPSAVGADTEKEEEKASPVNMNV